MSVASSNREGVAHAAGQVRHLAGGVKAGDGAGGVEPPHTISSHHVSVHPQSRGPGHPGRVGHTVLATVHPRGHAWGWVEGEEGMVRYTGAIVLERRCLLVGKL